MCLGLPGRVVAVTPGSELVDVEVAGAVRPIHVGLLDGPWQPGDWILIHSGFALERMTEDEAQDAQSMLRSMARGELAHDADPA
jgi:hydrogenase expression/formation protein HypC